MKSDRVLTKDEDQTGGPLPGDAFAWGATCSKSCDVNGANDGRKKWSGVQIKQLCFACEVVTWSDSSACICAKWRVDRLV